MVREAIFFYLIGIFALLAQAQKAKTFAKCKWDQVFHYHIFDLFIALFIQNVKLQDLTLFPILSKKKLKKISINFRITKRVFSCFWINRQIILR